MTFGALHDLPQFALQGEGCLLGRIKQHLSKDVDIQLSVVTTVNGVF